VTDPDLDPYPDLEVGVRIEVGIGHALTAGCASRMRSDPE